MVNTSPSHQGIDRIIDIEHYNNIMSLLCVTTYVIRFVNNLKTSQRSQRNLKELRADELKNTKTLWIKSVQASAFIKELSFLNRKDRKATPPIWVTQFGLFLSKVHTIKYKGRINNASLLPSTKSPLLLPAKHTLVSLLVKQAHDLVKHSGITATLTTLRERFGVLHGRETVKKILRHCIVCRRYEIATCKTPQFADLPNHQVSEDPPFSHTGLDFAWCQRKPLKGWTWRAQSRQSVRLLVHMHINQSCPSGTDSRIKCTRFSVSFLQICQQTRITGHDPIKQHENVSIFEHGNPKNHPITRSLEVLNQPTHQLELHCGKGSMVGRLLGKTRTKYQITSQESYRPILSEFRWTGHITNRSWGSD